MARQSDSALSSVELLVCINGPWKWGIVYCPEAAQPIEITKLIAAVCKLQEAAFLLGLISKQCLLVLCRIPVLQIRLHVGGNLGLY